MTRWGLPIAILAALALRLPALHWGLPSTTQTLSTFHPDESTNFYVMQNWKPAEWSFPPGKALWWGTVHIYSLAAVLKVAQRFHILDTGGRNYFETHLAAADRLYLVARLYSVFWGLLAILLGWRIAKQLWGEREACFTALLLAITPIQIPATVYAKVDALMVFWGLAVIWASLPLLQGKTNRAWIAGLTVGLAAATKYSAGAYLVLPITAILLSEKKSVMSLMIIGVSSFLGFCIGCPTVLFSFQSFWEYLSFNLSASKDGGMFGRGYAPWVLEYLRFFLPYALGVPLMGMVFTGIYRSWRVRTTERETFWLAINFCLIYLAITRPKFQLLMYTLPLLPCGVLIASRCIVATYDGFTTRGWQQTWAGLVMVLFVYTGFYSTAYMSLYWRQDSRVEASEWIRSHVQPQQTIAIAKSYYWTPPILRTKKSPYQILGGIDPDANLLNEVSLLSQKSPDYFVLSDSEMREFLRQPESFPEQVAALQTISKNYKTVARFEVEPHIGFLRWPKTWVPWDWMYPNPTITIFERKALS